MQKKWVKWVAVILVVGLLITTFGSIGYSLLSGL